MKFTSEERREVAASMREARDSISFLPNTPVEQRAYDAYKIILACIGYKRGNIFDILADLIDPTCHMDAIDTGEQADYECSEHIMHCLKCGAEFGYVLYSEDRGVSMDDKPRFCPNCGSRLVDDSHESGSCACWSASLIDEDRRLYDIQIDLADEDAMAAICSILGRKTGGDAHGNRSAD